MLNEHGITHRYREYRKDPFTVEELRRILGLLKVPATALLRKRDKSYAELGLNGKESDEVLIPHMVAHPTLVQRPIGILGDKAVIGRPVERLLELS